MTNISNQQTQRLWGILAQFGGSRELMEAVTRAQEAGYNSLEAFTPFAVDGLAERLKLKRTPMPWIILAGGLLGGFSVYGLVYWINLYAYPLNIGGRPLHSWPAFLPATFEGTVMGASLFAVIGVVLVCGLPRLHHPVFEIEEFNRASTDGFFLAVKSDAEEFDSTRVIRQLKEFGANECWEVPNV